MLADRVRDAQEAPFRAAHPCDPLVSAEEQVGQAPRYEETAQIGAVSMVATRRGRGCKEVISSRLRTTSCAARGRVSSAATVRTWSANAASRAARGCSQTWERHGFKRLAARIRWTVWGEIAATTSSITSCRA